MTSPYEIIDNIGQDIEPMHRYKPEEIAPHLGVSKSCVYRLIGNESLRAFKVSGVTYVLGRDALDFCLYHQDYLALFSTYGGRKRSVRTASYMRKPHPRKKGDLSRLRAQVYDTCIMLRKIGEPVSVRAVHDVVPGRTEHISQFVRQWKARNSGLKPVKKAA